VLYLAGITGGAQYPDGFPFWKACVRHDFGHRNYIDQGRCYWGWFHYVLTDKQFYNDMEHGVCDKYLQPDKGACYQDAWVYKIGVDEQGGC
jgi:hypothetical protein